MKSILFKIFFINLSLLTFVFGDNSVYTLEDGTRTHIPRNAILCADLIEVKTGAILTAYEPSNFCVTPSGSGKINYVPHITSNGGGITASVDVKEDITAVTTVTSTDLDGDTVRYSIGQGEDKDKFIIDSTTGKLSFITAPNFESPNDVNTDNTYIVEIKATDDGIALLSNTQTISVVVTDGNEAPTITSTPKIIAYTGQPYDYNILAEDFNNDILSWSVNEKPSWLEFSENKKQITFAGTGLNPIGHKDGTYDSPDGTDANSSKIRLLAGSIVATNEKVFYGDQEEYGIRYIDENKKIQTLISGDGKYQTLNPSALAYDKTDDILYIANYGGNHAVYKYENNTKTIIASNLKHFIASLLLDKDTNKLYVGTRSTIYEIDLNNSNSIRVIVGDEASTGSYSNTGVASTSKVNTVSTMDFDKDKNLIFVDRFNRIIRKIDIANNTIETIAGIQGNRALAGNGGTAITATFDDPSGLAIDHQGRIFISERLNKSIRVINTNGIIEHFADITAGGFLDTLAISEEGNLFIGTTNQILQLTTTPYIYGTPSLSDVGFHDVKLSVSDGEDSTNHNFQIEVKKSPDFDNDGISDLDEGANDIPPRDSDGDGTPDYKDIDSDNDTINDINEGKTDSDKDGKPDYIDEILAPTISSYQGANSVNLNTLENISAITSIQASGESAIKYSISNGAEKDKFSINEDTGELSFISAPDFENPNDSDTDNLYTVEVKAFYNLAPALSDTQTLNITVSNAHELLEFSSSANKSVTEYNQYSYTPLANSDSKNTNIEYSAKKLPSWLSFSKGSSDNSSYTVANNFHITHTNSITNYLVEIANNFVPYSDKLTYDTSIATSMGVTGSFDKRRGILRFTGTASSLQWEELLKTVKINLSSKSEKPRVVNFTEGANGDILSLEIDGNIHYYELVKTSSTWPDAKIAAQGKSFAGMQGYLVTITLEEENDLLKTKVNSNMWIGASDINSESNWTWQTGPEAGTKFFKQTSANSQSPNLASIYANKQTGGGDKVADNFSNWSTPEPNDWGINGEPYAHIRSDGTWNDYPATYTAYYIVEYGGMENDNPEKLTQVFEVSKSKNYMLVGTPKVSGVYDVELEIKQGDLSKTQIFQISVADINDTPVLNPAAFVIKEDAIISSLVGIVKANDEDGISPSVDLIGTPEILKYSIVSGNTNSDFTIDKNSGEIKVAKELNAYTKSRYTLDIKVSDDSSSSDTKQFFITVSNLDDKPVTQNDTAQTNEDTSVTIDVLSNDTDRDQNINPSSIRVSKEAQNGKVKVLSDGKITYTPNLNYNGNDSFSYEVYDKTSLKSNEASVTLTILPINDTPVSNNYVINTDEDIYVVKDSNLIAKDVDNETLTFTTLTAPLNGSVSYESNIFTYIPSNNFYGFDTFTFNAKDDENLTSQISTVYVNVAEVNDIPLAYEDSATVDEDSSVNIDVLSNDEDDEGIDSSSVIILNQAKFGLATVQPNGTITYEPNENYNGKDSFQYTVKDSGLQTGTQSSAGVLISNPATVSIEINPINDAPETNIDDFTFAEDSVILLNIKANDIDIDSDISKANITITTNPSYGDITITEEGLILFVATQDYIGDDSFSYKINDSLLDSNIVAVTMHILNDADKDGIADINDEDDDNDGIPDTLDNDDDNDGIKDIDEGANENPIRDSDNDGVPDYLDSDSDNDGVKDIIEGNEDSDNDGIADSIDSDTQGDIDTDNDGIPNSQEGAGLTPLKDSDGDGIPDFKDGDSDNDGILDSLEGNKDTDNDGIPDYLDQDSDNDGTPDIEDGSVDTDQDGVIDSIDPDDDNDGIPDSLEGTEDIDNDGIPNNKDTDSDGDGKLDSIEANLDSDLDGIVDYLDSNDNGSDTPVDNADGTHTSTFKKVKGSGDDKVTSFTTQKDKDVTIANNNDGSSNITVANPNSNITIKNDGSIDISLNQAQGNHDIKILNPGVDLKITHPNNNLIISTPVYTNFDGSTCQYDIEVIQDGNSMTTKHYINKGLVSQILTTVIMKIPNASLEINSNNEVVHKGEVTNSSSTDVKVTGVVSCDGSVKTITDLDTQNPSFVAINKAGSTVIIELNGDVDTTTKLEDSETQTNSLEGLNFKIDSDSGEITAAKVFKDKSSDQIVYTDAQIYLIGTILNVNGNKISNVDVDLTNVRVVQVDVTDTQNNTISSTTQIDNSIAESAISKISNGEDGQISTQVQLTNTKIVINNKLDGKIEHLVTVDNKKTQASSSIEGANTVVTNSGVTTSYDDSSNSGVMTKVNTDMQGHTKHILEKDGIKTEASSQINGSSTSIQKDTDGNPKIVTTVNSTNSNSQLVEIEVDAYANGTFKHILDINNTKTQASSQLSGANTTITASGQIETSTTLDTNTSSKVIAMTNGGASHEVKTSEFTTLATFNISGANTVIKTSKDIETTVSAKTSMCQEESTYVIVDVITTLDGKSTTKFDKYNCSDDSFVESINTTENQIFEEDNKIDVSQSNGVVEISTKTKLNESIRF